MNYQEFYEKINSRKPKLKFVAYVRRWIEGEDSISEYILDNFDTFEKAVEYLLSVKELNGVTDYNFKIYTNCLAKCCFSLDFLEKPNKYTINVELHYAYQDDIIDLRR